MYQFKSNIYTLILLVSDLDAIASSLLQHDMLQASLGINLSKICR